MSNYYNVGRSRISRFASGNTGTIATLTSTEYAYVNCFGTGTEIITFGGSNSVIRQSKSVGAPYLVCGPCAIGINGTATTFITIFETS